AGPPGGPGPEEAAARSAGRAPRLPPRRAPAFDAPGRLSRSPLPRTPAMAADTLFRRITDYANRADPYPLYAELREHGVARQDNGKYLVGTYYEIAALLHDPRIS